MQQKSLTPKTQTLPGNGNSNETDYKDKYDKIQLVIEDLNGKLMEMFHRKEQHLLEEYKKEMFRAQNQLNELRDNTNEEELKKKMIEKKEQLQKQREQFLQASIFFSNKCEQFKQKLAKVVSDTKDLQSEITFLNEQINNANANKLQLQEQLSSLDISRDSGNKSILQTIQKPRYQPEEETSIRRQKANTSLKRNFSQNNYTGSKSEIKKTKERTQRIKEILNDPKFQETEFQKMFIESVNAVKEQKNLKSKETGKTLPLLKKNPTQPTMQMEGDRSHRDYKEQRELPKIADSQLSDYDKRSVMEDFLSKQEVKMYLYKLIFKEAVEIRKPKQVDISQTPTPKDPPGQEHV